MKKEHVSLVAFNAAVLSAASAAALLSAGTQGALLALLAGAPMLAAVSLSELEFMDKAQDAVERDSLMFALQQVYSGMRYGGKSLLSSIKGALDALDNLDCGRVREMLSSAQKRLLLGAQPDAALAASCRGSGTACSALRDVGREYSNGLDTTLAVRNAYDRLCEDARLNDVKNASRLQKYLTANMAVGTVLPSFAVFAFTGYSMVYGSEALFSLFCAAMLAIVPNAFALVRIHTAGLYEI